MRSAGVPTVSVVVPAFNVAGYIEACLASVSAQTMRELECIVVDDGSTDDTAERVRRQADPRIRLIRQPNRGVSAARNAGLAAARARFVLFLDGDDMLRREALARLSACLERHPDAVAAYGSMWAIFEDGSSYPQKPLHRRRFVSGDLLKPLMRWEVFLSGCCTLVRAESARSVGGYNEALRLSEDLEFFCRLSACGKVQFVGAVPEVTYVRLRVWSASRELSPDWQNHLPTIRALSANRVLAEKVGSAQWQRLIRELLASQLWEAGRMNFIARRHAEARRLMLLSFAQAITPKRIALFAIAQLSRLVGVSLVPRLRFLDEDAR